MGIGVALGIFGVGVDIILLLVVTGVVLYIRRKVATRDDIKQINDEIDELHHKIQFGHYKDGSNVRPKEWVTDIESGASRLAPVPIRIALSLVGFLPHINGGGRKGS